MALVVILASTSTAFGARSYESQITQANGTPFTTPFAVAVDSSDNVWVSDTGTSIVSKFDSSGAYLAQNDGTGSWSGSPYNQGLAFGNSANLLYVADSNFDDLWGLNADASYSGTDFFGGAWDSAPHQGCCFLRVAVDNSGTATDGDIYVSSHQHGLVRIDGTGAAANFSASQSYITGNQITGTPDHAFSNPRGVAVDAAGNVYVLDLDLNVVDEFDATGTFVQTFSGSFGSITAVAIDPTNGDVLIGDDVQGVVHEFSPLGVSLGDTDGSGTPDGSMAPQGLAVDSTGRLYVADEAHPVVDVFGAGGPPPVTHSLTIDCTGGAGTGSVSSSPAGASCGASHDFNENSTVTLTATPDAHNAFVGWTVDGDTGVCPGTGTCDVAIGTTDHTVVAEFEPAVQHTVTASTSGAGSGTVTSSPGSISCPGTCSDSFDESTTATFTATPDAHNTFVGWTVDGDTGVCPGTGTCDVAIGTSDHTVDAEFEPAPQQPLDVTVTGAGSVSADSGAISGCTASGGVCSDSYDENSQVTLTATPDAGNHLASWGGDCAGTQASDPCVVTLDQARSVTADFAVTTRTLTVSKAGTGSGSVTSSPPGIDCGATCASSFDEGTVVTLTATPVAGSTFTGWSGPGAGSCAGTGTCDVTIPGASTSVTATFAQDKPTVTTTAGATGITQHAATVAGTVNPNSSTVSNCHIDYGKTTAYGAQKACSPAPGGGSSAVGVSAALSGLSAGTTYHFRVVATNAGGTTNGSDQTFKTTADTCATNAALCPPPPKTCATDPSLCPKPNPGVLKLDVAVAKVSGGKAALKLSCDGGTACGDQLTLTAKVKVRKGHKKVSKTVTLGTVTVNIAAGASETVQLSLNRTARKLLAKKHSLKATLTGTGFKHTVVLKSKAKKHHKKR